MLKRTIVTLGAVAAAFWIATFWLASDEHGHAQIEPIRSVIQGVAVTATVSGAFILIVRVADREVARRRVPVYVSTNALRDAGPITMEIPKIHREMAVSSTGGRTQDYWNAFADVAQTFFEDRDDDPSTDI